MKEKSGLAPSAGLIQYLSVSILALSFIFSIESLPKISMCAFNAVTGLSCPGCGLTRAFCAISHGQFALAWSLNPLSLYLYGLTVLGLLYRFFVDAIPEKLFRTTIFITIAALAISGFLRILIELKFI